MRVSLIVAVARNGVIGARGGIPWRLSADLKRFRQITMGKPVIMGRKTWESLPKRPLDGRDNIVISRQPSYVAHGAIVVPSFVEAVVAAERCAQASGADEILVIGGGAVYASALHSADRIYLTRIDAAPAGDTTFPIPAPAHWRETSRERLAQKPDEPHGGELIVLDRTT
jgi:dihydrofolate reductase